MRKYYYHDIKSPYIHESILNEIDFNKRWTLITNTDITDIITKQILDNEPHNDGKNLKVYQKSDDPTEIIITDIDGKYYVVDHSKYNPHTGEHIVGTKLGLSSTPNIGFFSTIISLYLDKLSDGYPIKVSAIDEKMWKSYNKVLEKVAKHNTNYHIGDINVEYNKDYDVTVYSRVVIPKGKRNIDYRNQLIESLKRLKNII